MPPMRDRSPAAMKSTLPSCMATMAGVGLPPDFATKQMSPLMLCRNGPLAPRDTVSRGMGKRPPPLTWLDQAQTQGLLPPREPHPSAGDGEGLLARRLWLCLDFLLQRKR